MVRRLYALSIIITLTSLLANADVGFDWIWPPPFGLVDSQKSIAPCGGFHVENNATINFLDQLRWNQTDAEISYMTRVTQTVDQGGTPSNWSELVPEIQADLGQAQEQAQFCVPISGLPAFRSEPAIFQLIANTPVGIIFAVSIQPASFLGLELNLHSALEYHLRLLRINLLRRLAIL
jgi:hypothetical protein